MADYLWENKISLWWKAVKWNNVELWVFVESIDILSWSSFTNWLYYYSPVNKKVYKYIWTTWIWNWLGDDVPDSDWEELSVNNPEDLFKTIVLENIGFVPKVSSTVVSYGQSLAEFRFITIHISINTGQWESQVSFRYDRLWIQNAFRTTEFGWDLRLQVRDSDLRCGFASWVTGTPYLYRVIGSNL